MEQSCAKTCLFGKSEAKASLRIFKKGKLELKEILNCFKERRMTNP